VPAAVGATEYKGGDVPGYGDIGVERGPERTDSTAARCARATLPWLLLLALSAALTACGGAHSVPQGSHAATSSAPSATLTPLPAPQSIPVGTHSARQSPPTERVLAQVNVVCTAVLHGFPPRLE
jgi:hypothetical protein